MQKQTTQEFERIPGQGYLFFRAAHDDAKTKAEQKALAKGEATPKVSIWSGWLALPGGHEVQVQATGSSRDRKYHITLREFGKPDAPEASWKKLAECELPAFGTFDYVDGSFEIEHQGRKRTYKLRMFRTDAGHIRLRLPQVANVSRAKDAMV